MRRNYEDMSRAGVSDMLVSCRPGAEELLGKRDSMLPYRFDYGIKNSHANIVRAVARQAEFLYPGEEYEDRRLAIGRAFADTYGTLMGAVRSGFIAGSLSTVITHDGFAMPVEVIHPDEDPRHAGYTGSPEYDLE